MRAKMIAALRRIKSVIARGVIARRSNDKLTSILIGKMITLLSQDVLRIAL
jgi:hypothetical protein